MVLGGGAFQNHTYLLLELSEKRADGSFSIPGRERR